MSGAANGDRNQHLRSAIAGWIAGFTVAFAFSWVLTNAYEALLVLLGGVTFTIVVWVAHRA